MRTCTNCQKSKPLDVYYRRANGAPESKCKECLKAAATARRNANIEAVRAYDRGRAMRPNRKQLRKSVVQSWRSRSPRGTAAHNAVTRALRSGKLVRQPCEVCGDPKTHAHHDDYLKPLAVRWLCTPHHKAWHLEHGEGANLHEKVA